MNFCVWKPKTPMLWIYAYRYSFMQSFYLQEMYLLKNTKFPQPWTLHLCTKEILSLLVVYQSLSSCCVYTIVIDDLWFAAGKVNLTNTSMRLKWGVGRLIADVKKSPIVLPFWHSGQFSITSTLCIVLWPFLQVWNQSFLKRLMFQDYLRYGWIMKSFAPLCYNLQTV